ncbi:WhiB family transcriptional regulator [Rhodococcus sp. IEGM 1351]|uniref:WhiB family transcriptional regulator n=1 Tax=Rhodococcus sp. IEGM 1351 TaxID=3047089 RepID=UPI0032D58B5D
MADSSPLISFVVPSPPPRTHPPGHRGGWMSRARCLGTDTAMFFSPTGEGRKARERREDAAKTLCAQCPVIDACRDHALTAGETYGVWGGTTEKDRRRGRRETEAACCAPVCTAHPRP